MVWSVVSSAFGDGRRSRKAVLGRILAYGSVFLSRARAERSTRHSTSARWAGALGRRDRTAARRGLTFSAEHRIPQIVLFSISQKVPSLGGNREGVICSAFPPSRVFFFGL